MNCCSGECDDGKDSDNITREPNPQQVLQFVQSGKSIQHPLKAANTSTNADAFAADEVILGIADGVSTVEDEGLDPSWLPKELLQHCLAECKSRLKNEALFDAEAEDLLSTCDIDLASAKFPLFVISKASALCTTYGSTTCVLAILDDQKLWSVNIGDSQLIVARRTDVAPKPYPCPQDFSYSTCHDARARIPNLEDYGGYQIVYRTVPQQHFFNCPYQFTRMPDTDCSGGAIVRKMAQTAEVGSVQVLPGDIVILGTDGLFDNLFDDDVLDILNRLCWPESQPGKPPTTCPAVLVKALLDVSFLGGGEGEAKCRCLILLTHFLLHTVQSRNSVAAFVVAAPSSLSAAIASARPFACCLRAVHWLVLPCPSPECILLQTAVKAGQQPPGVSWPVVTPFSKAAFDEVGRRLVGGKPDDITAVVAYIVPSAEVQNSGVLSPKEAASKGVNSPQKGWEHPDSLRAMAHAKTAERRVNNCSNVQRHSDLGKGSLGNIVRLSEQRSELGGMGAWCSRSSFPPRVLGITTPAIKASVHSVPKVLKETEIRTFHHLKEKAQQRIETVVSAGPGGLRQNEEPSHSWATGAAGLLNAFRSMFEGK
ncbi:T-cell activation protein phosphatase [Cyclospora cayetanensis]|uniref:Protein phosphatase n=1 Tax=Cyclospora cayetanensis TaxID=88456 RepID=A0A1D3D9J3_9EIME|nr:T-cell activation protein phosphatase [Cyclospora cayetanensis]